VLRALILPIALAITATAAPAASSGPLPGFRMPSRNIGCLFEPPIPGSGGKGVLRCDILSGLKPEPRRRCELDWTGVAVNAIGRASPTCAGDTAFDRRTPILRYGTTWRRAGIVCRSRRTGLRCTNGRGHGFVLARERWRVF
jgi:hypothetical protein